jgi:hypothetical protein
MGFLIKPKKTKKINKIKKHHILGMVKIGEAL